MVLALGGAGAAPKEPFVAPTASPVRNVILFVESGYEAAHWREARAAAPDGILARDRLPVTGLALSPVDELIEDRLGPLLATGREAGDHTYQAPILSLARRYGRQVALVSGRSVADPLSAAFAVSMPGAPPRDIARKLAEAGVEVLYGRAGAEGLEVLAEAGYRVSNTPAALLHEEQAPSAAAISAETVPFDTLFFRALHLVAKGRNGLMMVVSADPGSVPAMELDAALAAAVGFARRDGRSLVLLVSSSPGADPRLFAFGQGAEKFSGTIAITDVPKILAGLAGLKVFPRDYSPLFAGRSQPEAPALPYRIGASGKGPLPW